MIELESYVNGRDTNKICLREEYIKHGRAIRNPIVVEPSDVRILVEKNYESSYHEFIDIELEHKLFFDMDESSHDITIHEVIDVIKKLIR